MSEQMNARELIARIMIDHISEESAADAILTVMPEIVRAMVVPLVWDQLDPVTCGARSTLGLSYTAWEIDGYGYCHFPNAVAGKKLLGGLAEAQAAANAHNVDQYMKGMGLQRPPLSK
tara:strand:+ start:29207 stop:29560 length:354 start_codon:yes stop_codon:yes gene_type:complete